jgi:Spy/CpxP family protein refolding chaperone
MKKRISIVAIVAAVLALAAVPMVYAQHGFGHRHADGMGIMGFGFGHLDRIKAALDLSDAQVDQLKQIAADLRTQNAPYRQQVHGTMLQVAQTLLANPNDTSAAQALLDQQAQNERAMKQNALQAASKALLVLTPDQRAKVADFLSKRAAMHQQQ